MWCFYTALIYHATKVYITTDGVNITLSYRQTGLVAFRCFGCVQVWRHRPFLAVLLEYMTDVRYFHLIRDAFERAPGNRSGTLSSSVTATCASPLP